MVWLLERSQQGAGQGVEGGVGGIHALKATVLMVPGGGQVRNWCQLMPPPIAVERSQRDPLGAADPDIHHISGHVLAQPNGP
jgi:hypothetical protein